MSRPALRIVAQREAFMLVNRLLWIRLRPTELAQQQHLNRVEVHVLALEAAAGRLVQIVERAWHARARSHSVVAPDLQERNAPLIRVHATDERGRIVDKGGGHRTGVIGAADCRQFERHQVQLCGLILTRVIPLQAERWVRRCKRVSGACWVGDTTITLLRLLT